MLKKIFMLGALLGAATLASGQVSRVQEGKSVQRQDAEFVSEYITPTRIMLAEGGVTGTENLLRPYCGQVSTNEPNVCIFRNGKDGRSSVLLDFGKEIQGGIQIVRAMSGDKAAARFRVCFGESVSEALSSVDEAGATATNRCVHLVEGTRARITDTRKTLPGMRALQKYAVVVGGGRNHRFNLSDGAMLKDNHLDAYGGITPAVAALRDKIGHMVKIEVEVRNLAIGWNRIVYEFCQAVSLHLI